MAKSSIHFENVKNTSQTHNLRKRDFDYVRKDLTPLNKSYGDMKPHPEVIDELKKIIKEKTGRTAQAKAKFLIEGVFLFTEKHSNEDLVQTAREFGSKFKVRVKELHIHRDEGHYDKQTKIWHPNLHAHIVVENIDRNTGKSIKWNKEDLSSIQDFFAQSLKMERGIKSDKKHLSAIEYKIQKEQEDLERLLTNQIITANKDFLVIQGLILRDFKRNVLDDETSKKFIDFVANHPLKRDYLNKLEEVNKVNQKTQGNKRRLGR